MRLFHSIMHEEHLPCTCLQVHEPGMQFVVFDEDNVLRTNLNLKPRLSVMRAVGWYEETIRLRFVGFNEYQSKEQECKRLGFYTILRLSKYNIDRT